MTLTVVLYKFDASVRLISSRKIIKFHFISSSVVITAKNIPQVSRFLKDGVRGRKAFFKKFSSPPKNTKSLIPLFLWHKRRKEKAWQKENAVFYGRCPNPQAFEKA